jgi:spermidine/putrescine transport system substrate-binding protein
MDMNNLNLPSSRQPARRQARLAGLILLLVISFLSSCRQRLPELNIFIWSEYLDPSLVAEFEKRFGCRVNLDYYEDPESMMAKLSAGGASSYDIVVPADNNLPVLIQRGLVAPLRPENIPNLKHIAPEFRDLRADPGLRYGAPYFWGCVGLYVRRNRGEIIDESWATLFDPARQRGPFC